MTNPCPLPPPIGKAGQSLHREVGQLFTLYWAKTLKPHDIGHWTLLPQWSILPYMRKTSDVIRMLHRISMSHLAMICPMHKQADQFQTKQATSRFAHPQLNSYTAGFILVVGGSDKAMLLQGMAELKSCPQEDCKLLARRNLLTTSGKNMCWNSWSRMKGVSGRMVRKSQRPMASNIDSECSW